MADIVDVFRHRRACDRRRQRRERNKKILTFFLRLFLCPLVFITFLAFFIIIILPFKALRIFVSTVAKIFKSQTLLAMLSPKSCNFAVDDLYINPTCTIMGGMVFAGELQPERIEDRLEACLNSNKYPELKCTLTTWMGYHFWKFYPNFDLQNHFTVNDAYMTFSCFRQIRNDLVKMPFDKEMPLWHITFFPHYIPDNPQRDVYYSAVLIRVHHSLADGYSILKAAASFDDCKNMLELVEEPPFIPQRGKWERLFFKLKLFVYGPLELLETLFATSDNNPLIGTSERPNTGEYMYTDEDDIPLNDFQQIMQFNRVDITCILLATVSGTIHNFIRNSNFGFPRHFSIFCPFSLDPHPDNLTNSLTVVPIIMPIHEPDPLGRLNMIEDQLAKLKNSGVAYEFDMLISMCGSLPHKIIKFFMTSGRSRGTILLNSMTGLQECRSDCGTYTSVNYFLMGGIPFANLPIEFSIIASNNNIWVGIAVDKALCTTGEITERLMGFFKEDLARIKNGPYFDDMYH